MLELARFQDAFASALEGGGRCAPLVSPGASDAGMAVYRNTVAKAGLDALAASYPTVQRLMGEAGFAACVAAYRAASPPASPILAEYGAAFPGFLDHFGPACAAACLASVARIDRLWTRTHLAADGAVLTASDFAGWSAPRLASASFDLHPATRFAWFEEPAPTIWLRNRPSAPAPGDAEGIDWRPEGVVFGRPLGQVEALVVGAGGIAFLDACERGSTFAECAAFSEEAEPGCCAGELFAELVAVGAFAGR